MKTSKLSNPRSIFVKLFILTAILVGSLVLIRNVSNTTAYYADSGFSLRYPATWSVQVLPADSLYYPGVYFSPVTHDFSSADQEYTKGYVNITVTPVEQWLDFPLSEQSAITSADLLLSEIESQQKILAESGDIKIPGPPEYKGKPTMQFIEGAVEVSGVRTYDQDAFLYWVVNDEKLYEFYVVYPDSSSDKLSFHEDLIELMTSFGFEKN